MNPKKRKARTEAFLRKKGIPYFSRLPCVESEEDTELRAPEEVGIRMACLHCVVGAAFNPSEPVWTEQLREQHLWDHLTPDEAVFLSDPKPDQQTIFHFTWRCEALFLLMWAAGLVENLPFPDRQTNTEDIWSRFSPFDESLWPFIRGLTLRSKAEILDASDLIYRLHWATLQAHIEGQPPPGGLDPEVVQEWHHAVDWLTKYGDADWDEVRTDT